jgi:hypothetical protein
MTVGKHAARAAAPVDGQHGGIFLHPNNTPILLDLGDS